MIDVILIDDKEMKRLNKMWFNKKSSTDCIAFDDGEVYISIDRAAKQARERGVGAVEECLRLAVHGVAHIIGYDDNSLGNFCKMREKEWEVLCRLF
ncbi:MAG: rRNA maturation RNase YbeY [Deltaproteobacteria bacterium]|nr:rRNA maturation RNase YbeY [Deltaproteobacteria bacterium]MBI2974222.1 rRNA maturation RNase YbeY [Deltaproteobacteria bacterium]